MSKIEPKRLTNDQFMQPASSYQIFHHHVSELVELHWHEFFEMCFVLSGSGTNVVNGTPYPVSRGSLFLLTPADYHEIFSDPGCEIDLYNFIFSERMLEDEMYDLLFRNTHSHMALFSGERFAQIEAEFNKIWRESGETQTGQMLMVKGTLQSILVELVRASSAEWQRLQQPEIRKPAQGLSHHPGVQKALIYIHHHFRESLTLEDAARQAQLAPNYFSDRFRKSTGVPFQNYLQELRLKFAKSLIRSSSLSITEVCHASGFNTLTHFERIFKMKFGQSPRAYQRSE